MSQIDLMRKFKLSIPLIREWIENTLKNNATNAVSVASLSFLRLAEALPADILNRAKVVVVTGKVPVPLFFKIMITVYLPYN